MKLDQIKNAVFGDIDMADYPKFCDAYIESAEIDGRPATEAELESIQEDSMLFYTLLEDYIH